MSFNSKRRGRNNNRSRGKPFFQLHHEIQDHPNYRAMSIYAQHLLVHIGRFLIQGDGGNNGNLTCTFRQMQPYGWRSKETLSNALRQNLDAGFLVKTRAGGLAVGPSLYAVTWTGINDTGKRYDQPYVASKIPLRLWTTAPYQPADSIKPLPGNPRIPGSLGKETTEKLSERLH